MSFCFGTSKKCVETPTEDDRLTIYNNHSFIRSILSNATFFFLIIEKIAFNQIAVCEFHLIRIKKLCINNLNTFR